MLKIMIPENWAENPNTPPLSAFHQRPGSCHTCRIPMVPILQIHTQIPPFQISSLGYQLCQLFKILTYRDVQDTVSAAGGRPIGSLSTIHNNVPPITITLLYMGLRWVSRILHV